MKLTCWQYALGEKRKVPTDRLTRGNIDPLKLGPLRFLRPDTEAGRALEYRGPRDWLTTAPLPVFLAVKQRIPSITFSRLRSVNRFYLLRLARIYPVHLCTMLLFLACSWRISPWESASIAVSGPIPRITRSRALSLISGWSNPVGSPGTSRPGRSAPNGLPISGFRCLPF